MDKYNNPSPAHPNSEIDLHFFLSILRKSWCWVLVAALLCGVVVGVFTEFFVPRKYSSTIVMYVDPMYSTAGGSYSGTRAEELATIYPPVLRESDDFAKEVAARMAEAETNGVKDFPQWQSENSWKRVRSFMSIGTKDERLFYIRMTSTDPQEAYYLAKSAGLVAGSVLNEFVKAGDVKALTTSLEVPTSPVSPNIKRNVALAALIGAVVCFSVFFFVYLFDTTVYTEEDLQLYALPILGTVPSVPELNEKYHFAKTKGGRRWASTKTHL